MYLILQLHTMNNIFCFQHLKALIKGENNVESEEGDQNFYSWEPDPVDANPGIP